jgi:hypothetical protein
MGKRFKGSYDPDELTTVSVRQLRVMMKYVAKHDLWDKLERSLKKKGIDRLQISVHPIYAVQDRIEKTLKEKDKSGLRICGSDH